MRYENIPLGTLATVTKLAGFEFTKYMEYVTDGEIIAIRALNLRNGKLVLNDVRKIRRAVSDMLPRSKLIKNDIVLSYTGTIGETAQITESNLFHLAPNVAKITPDVKLINPQYLFCCIQSEEFKQQMLNYSHGSTQMTVPMKVIRELTIPVCDRKRQDQIAKVFSSINEEIELNKRINRNLEQQAQAIYAERFFHYTEETLPEGWRIVQLGDVATICNKTFNPQKEPEIHLEHYSIPAFDESKFPVFELSTSIKSNKFLVDTDCFMISKLNPTTRRVWRPYCITDHAVCSTEFIVYKAKDSALTDYLYSLIDSKAFSDFMCSHITGSTGSRQRTTPSDTLQFEFVLPPVEAIAEFTATVQPMYQQIKTNAIVNNRLKQLRNYLLPKLMSGEIDVRSVSI